MSTKQMSRIAILAAFCIALRIVFAPFPNVKPITAFFLVSLAYLDLLDCLLIMALTMIGSSLIFGVSVVVLWQIFSFLLLMLMWHFIVFPLTQGLKRHVFIQSVLAGVLAFSYGFWISIPIAYQFGTALYAYWLNGISFDVLHAVSTVLFYPIIHQLFRRFYHDEKIISRL